MTDHAKAGKIRWFLGELPGLLNANLLDRDAGTRLEAHYRAELSAAEGGKAEGNRKLVLSLVSVIASLFLAGGAISFIAWNWSALPIGVKTALAFFILVIPQAIGAWFLFFRQQKFSLPVREGVGVIHSILFGAAVAFLGQIWKLPADMSSFLLIWSISSLATAYLYRSAAALTLALGLSVSAAAAMQTQGGVGLGFIPLLAAAIPFYLRDGRIASEARSAYLRWIFAAAASFGIAVSLEKSVPGLWIVIYPAFFSLLALAGGHAEGEGKSWTLSPFRVLGALGLCLFAFAFVLPEAWKDIGWAHFRDGGKFHAAASVWDILLAAGLPAALLALSAFRYLKNGFPDIKTLLIAAAGLVPGLIYLTVAAGAVSPEAAGWMFVTLAAAAGAWLFTLPGRFGGAAASLLSAFLLLSAALAPFLLAPMTNLKPESMVFPGFAFAAALLYWTGVAYDAERGGLLAKALRTLGILSTAFLAWLFSGPIAGEIPSGRLTEGVSPVMVFSIVLLTLLCLLPAAAAWRLRRSERPPNFAVALYPLVALALFYFSLAGKVHREPVAWTHLLFLALMALDGFRIGTYRKSLLAVNASAALLIVAILTRFFDEETGFLIKAGVLTLCGALLLVLNAFLAKAYRKEAKNG